MSCRALCRNTAVLLVLTPLTPRYSPHVAIINLSLQSQPKRRKSAGIATTLATQRKNADARRERRRRRPTVGTKAVPRTRTKTKKSPGQTPRKNRTLIGNQKKEH